MFTGGISGCSWHRWIRDLCSYELHDWFWGVANFFTDDGDPGFDILGSPLVVIISTIIPLGISMGLVAEYLPGASSMYLIYVILGLAAVVWTRLNSEGSLPVQILVVVHGVSGLTIFGLPLVFSLAGVTPPGFLFFSLGGALMGLAGILLSALRAGKPIISQTKILTALPVVLLLVSAAFVAGFALG